MFKRYSTSVRSEARHDFDLVSTEPDPFSTVLGPGWPDIQVVFGPPPRHTGFDTARPVLAAGTAAAQEANASPRPPHSATSQSPLTSRSVVPLLPSLFATRHLGLSDGSGTRSVTRRCWWRRGGAPHASDLKSPPASRALVLDPPFSPISHRRGPPPH